MQDFINQESLARGCRDWLINRGIVQINKQLIEEKLGLSK